MMYLEKEKTDDADIDSYVQLNEWIEAHFMQGRHNYLLIDEVQEIASFEKAQRHWVRQTNVDIVVACSNAMML